MNALYTLAKVALLNSVVHVAELLLRQETTSFNDIAEHFERLHEQIKDLPACHLATIIHIVLCAACLLSRSECSPIRAFAISHLVSLVTRLRPKQIDFPICSGDDLTPIKAVHSTIFDSFKLIEQLEKFKFRFIGGYRLGEQKFISGCSALSNLASFTGSNATDEIAQAICRHCPCIREIDVSGSKKVTDRSIKSLIKCKKLQVVNLGWTAVSMKGREKLLFGTKSDTLKYIGYVEDLHKLLNRLKKRPEPLRTFSLQKLSGDGNVTDLQLVPTFFPKITTVKLEFNGNEEIEPDISALDQLKNVKKAKIHLYPKSADVFTNFNSHALTDLELEHWSSTGSLLQVKMTNFMKIGVQCPNIKYLSLHSFVFIDDTTSTEFYELVGRCFQKLVSLHWLRCYEVACFKVVLAYTFSIEQIDINDGFLADEFFEYILNTNPLARLQRLMLGSKNGISVNAIKRIITQCKKMSSIGDFSKFVALSGEQVQEVRMLIAKEGSRVEMKFDYF